MTVVWLLHLSVHFDPTSIHICAAILRSSFANEIPSALDDVLQYYEERQYGLPRMDGDVLRLVAAISDFEVRIWTSVYMIEMYRMYSEDNVDRLIERRLSYLSHVGRMLAACKK
jgi:hypothetical protein